MGSRSLKNAPLTIKFIPTTKLVMITLILPFPLSLAFQGFGLVFISDFSMEIIMFFRNTKSLAKFG